MQRHNTYRALIFQHVPSIGHRSLKSDDRALRNSENEETQLAKSLTTSRLSSSWLLALISTTQSGTTQCPHTAVANDSLDLALSAVKVRASVEVIFSYIGASDSAVGVDAPSFFNCSDEFVPLFFISCSSFIGNTCGMQSRYFIPSLEWRVHNPFVSSSSSFPSRKVSSSLERAHRLEHDDRIDKDLAGGCVLVARGRLGPP